VAVVAPAEPRPALEAEALIKEARRYQRRRWLTTVAVVALVAACVALVLVTDGPAQPGLANGRLQQVHPGGPSVNLSAMRDQGELAFVSRDEVYLIDGAAGKVHEISVAQGRAAVDPTFSPDGKWVAYETESSQTPAYAFQLWVARADGTDRHQIRGVVGYYGWSPIQDLIAVSTATSYTQVVRGSPYRSTVATRLEVVTPTGARRDLVGLPVPAGAVTYPPPGIWDAVWSPSGAAIAVAIDSFMAGSIIRSYPVGGGKPTTWFSINGTASLTGTCSGCGGGHTIAQLAGWWANWGIGFWVFSSGAVHGQDSSPLELVRAARAVPRIIGFTLSNGTTDALASSATGGLAIVASTLNAGRSYGIGKEVETCDLASLTCSPVPRAAIWTGPSPVRCAQNCSLWPAPGKPGSAVSLDPAWSPDGKLLAYVKSPSADTGGQPSLSWFQAHRLFVFNPATRRSAEVTGADGVSVPTWSRNGQDILYVRNDALWASPALGGKAVEVETPLFPPAEWEDVLSSGLSFYGQVAWADQFNWWSR
jgi:hypothetical protein